MVLILLQEIRLQFVTGRPKKFNFMTWRRKQC